MHAENSSSAASRRGVQAATSFGLVLTLLTAPGCAGTQIHHYQSLKSAWDRAESAADRGAPADDPLDQTSELEREALVRLVLERNPNIRAARYAWRAALERYPQVTSLDDPMLGIGAAPRSFGSSAVDNAPKYDLSQRLPFPGKLALRGEVVLAEAEAAAQHHDSVRLRLATMASLLFDDYYLVARSLEINAENVALLGEFQRIATARYEVGEASQQDPIQAEVELVHSLHRDVVLETRRKVVSEQLNALLHRRGDWPLPPPPRRLNVPEPQSLDAPVLVTDALRERPELRAADARVRASEATVGVARREFFPDLTLAGSYNKLWQESDLRPFVGITINVPLRVERRRAALEEAKARLERARSERTALEDDVRFGVQAGVDRLSEARHVMRLFEDRLVPAARDQVEAARSGFEAGRNSFLALIDAQRNFLNAELGLEEARTDLTRRRAELDRSLGRVPSLTWEGTTP